MSAREWEKFRKIFIVSWNQGLHFGMGLEIDAISSLPLVRLYRPSMYGLKKKKWKVGIKI